MNIEQANAIPMPEILAKLGFQFDKFKGDELWYKSPFRNENTASFAVNTAKNVWYDHGIGNGGKSLSFVIAWLKHSNEDYTCRDALRWFENMFTQLISFSDEPADESSEAPKIQLQKIFEVTSPALISYIEERCISVELGKKHFKEAHLISKETGKKFFALAFANVNGGYELRNKAFKGCIAPKSISFIRGSDKVPKEMNVFEGAFDFLSALEVQKSKQFKGDTIILNSVKNIQVAEGYIKTNPYKTINTWLDNNEAGEAATQRLEDFAAEINLAFKRKNDLYKPHEDVNEHRVQKMTPVLA